MNTAPVRQSQLDNMWMALILWGEVEPEKVNLNTWKKRTRCGTVACFGGHLASWPEFKEQGVELRPWGDGGVATQIPTQGLFGMQVAGHLFGVPPLFQSRGDHPIDYDLIQNEPGITDHELVARRLENSILNHDRHIAFLQSELEAN